MYRSLDGVDLIRLGRQICPRIGDELVELADSRRAFGIGAGVISLGSGCCFLEDGSSNAGDLAVGPRHGDCRLCRMGDDFTIFVVNTSHLRGGEDHGADTDKAQHGQQRQNFADHRHVIIHRITPYTNFAHKRGKRCLVNEVLNRHTIRMIVL